MIPSFGIRISSEFENMNLDLDNIAEFKVPDVPPWTFSQPRVLFSLHNDKIWLVGCFWFNGPLRQYFSLYRAVSQRQGERIEMG